MAVETRNNPAKLRFASNRVVLLLAMMFACFFLNALGATVWGAPAPQSQATKWEDQLPPGEGRDIVASDCVLCHTLERVVISHRSHGEWDKLVGQMIERGAPLADDQIPTVLTYLAKNFGPGHVYSPAPPAGTAPSSAPAAGPPKSVVVDPDQAQFTAVPDSLGLPKDVQMSIIAGDPTQAGPYSMLLKIPAGVVIPPHSESTDENIVALRGTFEFGEGDNFDASKLQTLKPQTPLLVTAGKNTFGRTKEATILMISGTGPISFGHDKSN